MHPRLTDSHALSTLLAWCAANLGPVHVLSEHSRQHGGHESATYRLHSGAGFHYLKVHQSCVHWHNEAHAYAHWARAFDDRAPRLVAVHDVEPLALIISEVPGEIVETARLSLAQGRAAWRAAGVALVALHHLTTGSCFGPCRRDGSCAGGASITAEAYVAEKLERQIARAVTGGYLHAGELPLLEAALANTAVFAGEQPIPCHRDYCAANWLVNADGEWSGVIDFEFAHWDVRVADFSRDPDWSWMRRPDLAEAFYEGYDHTVAPVATKQLFIARVEYALGAIVWGRDHAFFGFEAEGHAALAQLASHPLI